MSPDLLWQSFDPSEDALPSSLHPTDGDDITGVVVAAEGGGIGDRTWSGGTVLRLAREWARAGRRVFVADLSLEEPLLHRLLDEENGEGMADALLFGVSVRSVARAPAGAGFYFAPAGTVVADSAAVLEHPRWETLAGGFRGAGATFLLFVPTALSGAEGLLERADRVLFLRGEETEPSGMEEDDRALAVLGPAPGSRPTAPDAEESLWEGEDSLLEDEDSSSEGEESLVEEMESLPEDEGSFAEDEGSIPEDEGSIPEDEDWGGLTLVDGGEEGPGGSVGDADRTPGADAPEETMEDALGDSLEASGEPPAPEPLEAPDERVGAGSEAGPAPEAPSRGWDLDRLDEEPTPGGPPAEPEAGLDASASTPEGPESTASLPDETPSAAGGGPGATDGPLDDGTLPPEAEVMAAPDASAHDEPGVDDAPATERADPLFPGRRSAEEAGDTRRRTRLLLLLLVIVFGAAILSWYFGYVAIPGLPSAEQLGVAP